jgi:hypothetical protein
MTPITIDKKKYVLIPEKEFKLLQRIRTIKNPEKLLTLEGGKARSKKLAKKWINGKL